MCKRNKTAAPTKEKNYNFQKLTPVQDASIEIYSDALDKTFKEDDIRNIAITGTYGSGKSSVIETYEKQHAEYKFVHLSLAHFDQEDLQNKDSKTENKDIKTIEGQLLNQLVHKIKKRKIPETQFSIKKHRSKLYFGFISFVISLCVLLFFTFSHNEAIMGSVLHIRTEWLKNVFMFFLKPDHIMVRIVPLLLLLFFISYKFLYNMAGRKFIHKLNVQGNEIELFSDQDDSVFDKYLNEILYLFEHSEADAVVFEDIDRFKNTLVFERLREINALLCERQKRKIGDSKKIIRFFYLIRDDLFINNEGKDRTKFFDFIIPIVPVVDGSNSYDILHDYFTRAKVLDKFDDTFLRRISLYIDDLRILKNMYNEFWIYNEKLNLYDLDYSKLFAIIVYKNIFPHDFAELQLHRGFVCALFDGKDKLIKKQIEELEDKKNNQNDKLEYYYTETARSIEELNAIKDYYYRSGRGDYGKWLHEEYPEREKKIKEGLEPSIDKLKREIEEIDKKLIEIHNCKLVRLLTMDNFDDYVKDPIGIKEENYTELKTNHYYKLLKVLITDGFIDESYSDYMSIFYPNSITLNDKKFTHSVLEGNASEYDYAYHLENPGIVMRHLKEYDFTKRVSLNYDLFDYLLEKENGTALKNNIDLIKETEDFDFINGYICSRKGINKMVAAINREWPSAFKTAKQGEKLSSDVLLIYSYKTIENSDDQTFENADEWVTLRNYISDDPDYINQSFFESTDVQDADKGNNEANKLEDESGENGENKISIVKKTYDRNKIKAGLLRLKVSFSSINGKEADKELLDYVCANHLYTINADNIRLMITECCNETCDDEFLSKFMSYIFNQDNPCCEYLRDNMEDTIWAYFEMYKGSASDDSDVIVKVINDNEISDDNKKMYLEKLSTKVEDLSDIIENNNRQMVLKSDALEYNGGNLLYYYTDNSLDKILIEFINAEGGPLSFSEEDKKANTNIDRFLKDCIICNDIKDQAYENIAKNIKAYDTFNLSNISDNHISILIKLGKIVFNPKNLDIIRSQYPQNVAAFIVENIEEYVDSVRIGNYKKEDIRKLLENENLGNQYKLQLVELSITPISIADLKISDTIKDSILASKFDTNDLSWLIGNYEKESPRIKGRISNLVKEHIDIAAQFAHNMGKELRQKIFGNYNIDQPTKLQILDKTVDKMNEEEVIESLRAIDADAIADNLEGKHNKVENNTKNTEIITILLNKNLIQTPKITEDKRYYETITFRVKD